MNTAKGGLLIVAGLFVVWLGVSGRLKAVAEALGAVRAAPPGGDIGTETGTKTPTSNSLFPGLGLLNLNPFGVTLGNQQPSNQQIQNFGSSGSHLLSPNVPYNPAQPYQSGD